MPEYSPLPPIELDPRSESELVTASARRVFEASNGTINDFSSGSPVVALLEGQAFAQAEFLHFANQFPEAVLVEWIGPFLGAQRRTGSGAIVNVQFSIDPRDQEFVVFPGYEVATDANLTGGVSFTFVTTEQLVIPAGTSTGEVRAVALIRGSNTNVAANTITRSVTSLDGVKSVTNLERALGGTDPELLAEVKERFFSLIRRRNPVSAEDWQDFFTDALGPGTATTVLPRRSQKEVYRYDSNYVDSAPAVSFFVLNPDGSPITEVQQSALQNLVKWSLPTEFLGYVYPMEVDDIDVSINLSYDATKPYSQNLRTLSRTIRDNLFAIMQANAVFPTSYDPSVSDLEGALTTSFPLTLGVSNAYIDPDILSLKAYYPPKNIALSGFKQTTPQPFYTGFSIQENDLVVDNTGTSVTYYEALQSFNPAPNTVPYFVNTGDLSLEIIEELVAGQYKAGDVVFVEQSGFLHVALTSFGYDGRLSYLTLIENGYISGPKEFTAWGAFSYTSKDSNGNYDPQIIAYDEDFTGYNVYTPQTPSDTIATRRPGYPVLVVANDFTVTNATTDLGYAQNLGFISENVVIVQELTEGQEYLSGQYVQTTDPSDVSSTASLQDVCYTNQVTGAIQIHARVLKSFTFTLDDEATYEQSIDALVAAGFLEIVRVVPFIECNGTSSFNQKPFRYTARFAAGEYVRYRPEGGFDSSELEECMRQTETCTNVTSPCKKLIEGNLPLPRYFFTLVDFTPYTSDLDQMIADEVIAEVPRSAFIPNYKIYLQIKTAAEITPDEINSALVNQGQISSNADLEVGNLVQVFTISSVDLAVYSWNGTTWDYVSAGMPVFRDMFRFAPKDVAMFRNGQALKYYVATDFVTPLMDLEVYFDAGIFESSTSGETVKYYDSEYRMEDTIYTATSYSPSFYRVTRSFTPPALTQSWAGEVDNTVRIEELYGNTLKFVSVATCEQNVSSRLPNGASTIKLGTIEVSLTSKTTGSLEESFVWESTKTSSTNPQLSYYPGTDFSQEPVDYGDGTLAL